MKTQATGNMVRLGLVGVGSWGEQVALSAALDSGVELVACYARTAEAREAFAVRHGCWASVSYEEMLAEPSIQGIVVMSANRAHRGHVEAAAAAGKHVLVTKPIATTIADGQAIIEACRRAGVILAVGHQSRREPAIRRLKALLVDGTIGRPVMVEANISTAVGTTVRPDQWRWLREECPGGPLMQLGIHHLDTLQYLLGPIEQVVGWQRRSLVQAEIDDVTATLLAFAGGITGYLGAGYASSQACWIKVYGTAYVAHYDQHLGLTLSNDTWATGPVRRDEAPGIPLLPPIPTMREEVSEFTECIRSGKPPEIDGEQALRNLAVVLAAVRSQTQSRAVAVAEILEGG
ncbi:MAG TPA: Gfo/Idh/MocA family oxidoreductase [Anaerolineae bacterium]|nr:Gfo/Idh/MocA family oxidoreductase [Anaerolineae bacterium]